MAKNYERNFDLPEGWKDVDSSKFIKEYNKKFGFRDKQIKLKNKINNFFSKLKIPYRKKYDPIFLEDFIAKPSINNSPESSVGEYDFELDMNQIFKKSKKQSPDNIPMEIFRPEEDETYFINHLNEDIKKIKLNYNPLIGGLLISTIGFTLASDKNNLPKENLNMNNPISVFDNSRNSKSFIKWGEAINFLNKTKSLEEIKKSSEKEVSLSNSLGKVSKNLSPAKYNLYNNTLELVSTSNNQEYTTFNLKSNGKVIGYKKAKVGEKVIFNLPENMDNFEVTEHSRDENKKINQSYKFTPTNQLALIKSNSLEEKILAQSPANKKIVPSLAEKTTELEPIFLNAYDRLNYYEGNLGPLCLQDVIGKAEDITMEYNLLDSIKRNNYTKQVIGFNEEEVCKALNQTRKMGYNINYSASFYKHNKDATEQVVQAYKNSKSTKEVLQHIQDSLNLNVNKSQLYSILNIYKKDKGIIGKSSRSLF